MDKIKQFLDDNKVFIFGLLSALALILQQFVEVKTIDPKVLGYALLVGVLSYFAKEWRGQALTLTGIIGNSSAIFVSMLQNGSFSWTQFALQAILLVISTAVPDPKSRGYEATPTIMAAKEEGEAINPASLTSK